MAVVKNILDLGDAKIKGNLTTGSGQAYDINCVAEGENTEAMGKDSHAEGEGTQTTNLAEHAEGRYNKSNTNTRSTIGIGTSDSDRRNAMEVMSTGNIYVYGVGNYDGTNPNNSSTLQEAIGLGGDARGHTYNPDVDSLAEGEDSYNVASGQNSHAEGARTKASGYAAHSEGMHTEASGGYSHAEGYGHYDNNDKVIPIKSVFPNCQLGSILTFKKSEFDENQEILTDIVGSIIKKSYNINQPSNTNTTTEFIVTRATLYDDEGDYVKFINVHVSYTDLNGNFYEDKSISQFWTNVNWGLYLYYYATNENNAVGFASHVEGYSNKSLDIGTHAEGVKTIANGIGSHSEGFFSNATGEISHAEGYCTEASDFAAHSEGTHTEASGRYSHAESYYTEASGFYAHAEGAKTKATGEGSHAEGMSTEASGMYSHSEGYRTEVSGSYSHAEGSNTIAYADGSHAEGYWSETSGTYGGHAEGMYTEASGEYGNHAEGYDTYTGQNYFTKKSQYLNNLKYNNIPSTNILTIFYDEIGYDNLHYYINIRPEYVISNENECIWKWDFVQTFNNNKFYLSDSIDVTKSYKHFSENYFGASHAEGMYTEASGWYGAHAEGYFTEASGNYSHAEGGTYITNAKMVLLNKEYAVVKDNQYNIKRNSALICKNSTDRYDRRCKSIVTDISTFDINDQSWTDEYNYRVNNNLSTDIVFLREQADDKSHKNYFYFQNENQENECEIFINGNAHNYLQYSFDNINWHNSQHIKPFKNRIYFRGILTTNCSTSSYITFGTIGKVSLHGNINVLWNYEDLNAPLKEYCGYRLFSDCDIIRAEELEFPALTLATGCYKQMFRNCYMLLKSPRILQAADLSNYCYQEMFYNCKNLVTAPELPSVSLAQGCYQDMFYNCKSLKIAPILPATLLVQDCYREMFYNCTLLEYIKCMAKNLSASNCTNNWVYGVAQTNSSEFIKDAGTDWPDGISGIPNNWDESDLSTSDLNGLLFTAEQANSTIGLLSRNPNHTLWYAKYYYNSSGGSWKWSKWYVFDTDTIITLTNEGDMVKICGYYLGDGTESDNTNFSMTGQISVNGNCNEIWNCYYLNAGLRPGCGYDLFNGCTSLLNTPKLPALTMANECYNSMFENCTSLTTAPELPATKLANGCYSDMFDGCTNLIHIPQKLPATLLANSCYSYMFANCRNLTTAPELPALVLVEACYNNMFTYCTHLNYIKCLATDISATNCTTNWVDNVASNGIFTKAPNMSSWTSGSNGIPTNWTQTAGTPYRWKYGSENALIYVYDTSFKDNYYNANWSHVAFDAQYNNNTSSYENIFSKYGTGGFNLYQNNGDGLDIISSAVAKDRKIYKINSKVTPGENGKPFDETNDDAQYYIYKDSWSEIKLLYNAKPYGTKAAGWCSHSEGMDTFAEAAASHAGGISTIADQEAMMAIGKFNASTNEGDLFAIGNGISDSSRSTIFKANSIGTVTKGLVKIEDTSTNAGGTMQYDPTERCIKFSFA